MDYTYIDKNLARVREDLRAACEAGGYDPAGVTLMAAIKSAVERAVGADILFKE